MKFIISVFLFCSGFVASAQAIANVSFDSISNYKGKTVTICESVQSTFFTPNNHYTILNFGGLYPDQKFMVLIKEKHLKNFSYKPLTHLLGKNICITGTVKIYNHKPEIIVKNESEISIQN